MPYRRKKLTPTQKTVLGNLAKVRVATGPRASLELLTKKGLASGSRKDGWVITRKGLEWLAVEAL